MRKIFMLVMALLSGAVNATDFVYRVDSRPPGEVFRDGFRSHGSNRNLQQHIRGDSCAAGSRDSAFIATTTSLSETYNIARQYYSSSTFQRTLYRYRIRANNIFYPIQPSVNYLEGRGVTFSGFEQIMMREQNEIVAVEHIPTENIAEAVELTYDRFNSTVRDGAGTSNARYLSVETTYNPGVIPDLVVPTVSVRDRISAFGSLISACFSLKGVRRGSEYKVGNYYEPEFYDARGVLESIFK
ncbi:TPA: pertussis toxin-like subunit ArtA [Escherichia coli]|uniref:scabin-related ADP-ribosyltransferase n=1 Tax=Escherichia coli TaxID=562 RepID=UPI000750A9F7|nr:enterotoxin A family protein [Escherichia coli]EIQ4656880.1 pertussis toxin-like subunit ArtA [Escherichia coli]KUS85372.1 pertussis toxin-like subunit ArtA [Escherichia coli]HAZ3595455.1 pertussis toxin-like subunit ArtA [Escherichia coli]HAZ3604408.1 pertussis toxin-like subunit ArtA [Escherichia coli]HAZ3619217.1 pertussis toxin-like subunit ArtA [Escherichia coli]